MTVMVITHGLADAQTVPSQGMLILSLLSGKKAGQYIVKFPKVAPPGVCQTEMRSVKVK